MGKPSRRRAEKQPDIRQAFAAGASAPKTPLRPSQVVHESTDSSPDGQHFIIAMERLSTGGTHHVAKFQRTGLGPLSVSERKQKSRAKASLFPEKEAEARDKDAERKQNERAAAASAKELAARIKAQRISELTEQYANDWSEQPPGWDQHGVPITSPWLEPARRAHARYAAEQLGIPGKQLLVSDEWMLQNMPVCIEEAARRDIDFKEFIGIDSPYNDSGDEDDHLIRVIGVDGLPSDTPGATSSIDFDITYSRPPSPAESMSAQNEWRERHRLREQETLVAMETDVRAYLEVAPPEGDVAELGSRGIIIDFLGNGSAQARQAANIMRDAFLSCRTLFSSNQLPDSCGYNSSTWA